MAGHVVGLTGAVLLIGELVTLPFSLALRARRVDYGLTNQGLGAWLVDEAKGLGLGIVFTSIALLILFGCVRRWRTWWPVIVSGVFVVLVMVGSFLYPVVVEPVFNDFESMPDSACGNRSSRSRTRRVWPWTTCWSRTRRGVRPR